ncbi:uncharacterized protein LOC122708283 isoform X4 [Cervus elaphus]|uniref:uncharacterized protein LOC122452557 isoform X1 n=1 Tax=Cervus canadensis TaxID=1574408 RepID=UPI001C9E662C|nr:uncharacterized protein LOC122452557 isoform X1 [Cervus canadensis]XP_043780492.1 uncharacterized protein LOC122708283 isoform X4 [Cervus elaphus]
MCWSSREEISHVQGCIVQKARRKIPRRSRRSVTSWLKRVSCWPHNRVHALTDPDEELPEGQVEEVSNSTLEEEALPSSVTCEADNEHASQESLVMAPFQDLPEVQALSTVNSQESGEASEHASQESLVMAPFQDLPEVQALSTVNSQESGEASEHASQESLVMAPFQDLPEVQALSTVNSQESGEASEHASQESLVMAPFQDLPEVQALSTVNSQESGEASEHGGFLLTQHKSPVNFLSTSHHLCTLSIHYLILSSAQPFLMFA